MSSSRQPQPRRSSGRTPFACEPCRKRKSKCDGEKPVCGSCQSHELACHYEPARPTRRQKYWDRDYVQALEDQVRLLSASLQQAKDASSSASASPASQPSPGSSGASKQPPPPLPYGPKMLSALHDFGSVKWADITGRDGLPTGSSRPSPAPGAVPSTEAFLLAMASDLGLKRHLKAHFLEHINPYYKVATPKLGCPTGIPWEPDTITPYIDTVSPETVDVAALSFDHHCRLYHVQQRYIDVMYSPSYHHLPAAEEAGGQRVSSGNFWACFRVLGELGGVWRELSEGAIPFVLMATRGWGFQEEVMSVDKPADEEEEEEEGDDDFEAGIDDLVGQVEG
ncbi:hypothetical protein J3F83DRAFT_766991 [Trichoderma novae-zelandiae]